MYAMVDRSGLDEADVDTEGLDMHEAALSQPSIIWLDEADDAGRYTDLPDFDIPEDPGVPEKRTAAGPIRRVLFDAGAGVPPAPNALLMGGDALMAFSPCREFLGGGKKQRVLDAV
jgi:hypothetical protein